MKKAFGRLLFWVLGWKIKNPDPASFTPSVMIAAPHTSNWDFPIAIGAFWVMGVPLRYFIKDSYTRGIFGWFFKWSGAIGVNRSHPGGLVEFAIETLKQQRDLVVLVPAEGTRKRVDRWKTGFYRIALGANVPIALGYLDYAKKEAGIREALVFPTGDYERDMQPVEAFYASVTAKHPALYGGKVV